MERNLLPRIVSAERLENSVIIGFDNGHSAVYTASLLYKVFARAQDITTLDNECFGAGYLDHL